MKNVIFSLLFISFLGSSIYAQTAFNVTVRGEANEQAILFFPGFANTGSVWDDAVDELSKNYKCYVFTFAGFGEVPPIEEPWLLTIKNQIVQYVIDQKLEKPILVGHSLGGTLSYWLAISEPDMFKKIIAVDALPGSVVLMIPNYDGKKLPYDNPQSQKILQMDDTSFGNMIDQQIQYMCLNKEKQQYIAAMMKTADRKTYVHGYIDMLNLDLREDMGKIKIPVTVLAATYPDKAIVEPTYKAQFKELPSVEIHYADNAAHYVMFDRPNWFMEILKKSLE